MFFFLFLFFFTCPLRIFDLKYCDSIAFILFSFFSISNVITTVPLESSSSLRELQLNYGTKLNSQKAHLHLHPWNSNSNCDVIFDSCVPPKVCTIQSPNFPGFYLRNVTCNYWFKESNVPSGYRGYYIIQSKVCKWIVILLLFSSDSYMFFLPHIVYI